MTNEQKQLLLQDLCARLPYRTKCYCKWSKEVPNGTSGCVQELSTFLIDELEIMGKSEYDCQISGIKPYLRPMSSMTDEEKERLQSLHNIISDENYGDGYSPSAWDAITEWEDYCNSRHLDYRGLIPMELALEAPKNMYIQK